MWYLSFFLIFTMSCQDIVKKLNLNLPSIFDHFYSGYIITYQPKDQTLYFSSISWSSKQHSPQCYIYLGQQLVVEVVSKRYKMRQEKNLLALTEIIASLEYKLESKVNTNSSLLLLYTLLSPIPPSHINSSPYNNLTINQNNLHQIICQQQKQLATMQAQIQALLVVGGSVTKGPNTKPNVEVANPPVFSGKVEKVGGFIIIVCRLFLKMKMRKVTVEKQIQWCYELISQGWK